MSEAEEAVSPAAAQQLKIIAGAMGGGLALMAGLVFWTQLNATKIPDPRDVRFINLSTTVAMIAALLSIALSEFTWRSFLRKTKNAQPFSARVQSAFILRMAFREGGALLAMTVAYVAAANGVLRVYPAYWVNLAPIALFLSFLAAHWPSAETLTAEARDAAGSNPSFSKK